jgi:hypothetical protein
MNAVRKLLTGPLTNWALRTLLLLCLVLRLVVSPCSVAGLSFHMFSGFAFGRLISPSLSWLLHLGSLVLSLLRVVGAYFILT